MVLNIPTWTDGLGTLDGHPMVVHSVEQNYSWEGMTLTLSISLHGGAARAIAEGRTYQQTPRYLNSISKRHE